MKDIFAKRNSYNSLCSVNHLQLPKVKLYNTESMSQNGSAGLSFKTYRTSSSPDDINFKCEAFETIWIEVEGKIPKSFYSVACTDTQDLI